MFLHAQDPDIVEELANQRRGKPGFRQVQYILHDVVAKRILHQWQGVIGYFGDQLHFLLFGRVVEAALEDAAAVLVAGDFHAVFRHGSENKL